MSSLYKDPWIECTDDAVRIRAYYFPWGTKTIPYSAIRAIRKVPVGKMTGKGRIWGSTTLRYWANLDPGRPGKDAALVLERGKPVRPFITPDDPDAVAAVIAAHSGVSPSDGHGVVA